MWCILLYCLGLYQIRRALLRRCHSFTSFCVNILSVLKLGTWILKLQWLWLKTMLPLFLMHFVSEIWDVANCRNQTTFNAKVILCTRFYLSYFQSRYPSHLSKFLLKIFYSRYTFDILSIYPLNVLAISSWCLLDVLFLNVILMSSRSPLDILAIS